MLLTCLRKTCSWSKRSDFVVCVMILTVKHNEVTSFGEGYINPLALINSEGIKLFSEVSFFLVLSPS